MKHETPITDKAEADSIAAYENDREADWSAFLYDGFDLARVLECELNATNAEIERLENLTASDIHTCSEQCQRPMCVMRRQLRDANAKIAELEAQLERDRWAISPAMAQARINTLAAENQGQRDAITELRKELELLKEKSPQRRGPYGKLEDFDPFDPV